MALRCLMKNPQSNTWPLLVLVYTMGMRIKPPTTGQKIANEIEQLRAERDEARQEICESHCDSLAVVLGSHITPHDYAQRRGWDCYKENTNA